MPTFRTVVNSTGPLIGGTGVNTFTFRVNEDSPLTDVSLNVASQALLDFYTGLQGLGATGTVFTHDGVWQQILDPAPVILDVPGWSVAMDNSGTGLPPATAMCVTWRTPLATRRGRGRTFISPLSSGAMQSNGTPTEAARTKLQTAAANLYDGFGEPGDGAFCVFSPTDNVVRDITGSSVSNLLAVLRSRRD